MYRFDTRGSAAVEQVRPGGACARVLSLLLVVSLHRAAAARNLGNEFEIKTIDMSIVSSRVRTKFWWWLAAVYVHPKLSTTGLGLHEVCH